jgi:hypothetical protein
MTFIHRRRSLGSTGEVGVGFYIRVAPGLRLRLTSRGVRASIGPRISRLHFGAGGPGISTGAGPISYYQPLDIGGGAAPIARGRAAKLEQARQVNAIWDRLMRVHQAQFPELEAPVIQRPDVPEQQVLVRQRRKQAVKGIGWFRRAERRRARDLAEAQARSDWRQMNADADVEQARQQQQADAWWARLLANDPQAVMDQLADAFEDNESPAAPLDVAGSEVSIALLAPPDDAIPARMGKVTAAGNPSLAKLAKGERGMLVTSITMGYALVTIREAFAVAPGLDCARVVVLRKSPADSSEAAGLECVAAGRWRRDRLAAADWSNQDAGRIAIDSAEELLLDIRGGAPRALDLADEPELRDLIEGIDTSDLGQGSVAMNSLRW